MRLSRSGSPATSRGWSRNRSPRYASSPFTSRWMRTPQEPSRTAIRSLEELACSCSSPFAHIVLLPREGRGAWRLAGSLGVFYPGRQAAFKALQVGEKRSSSVCRSASAGAIFTRASRRSEAPARDLDLRLRVDRAAARRPTDRRSTRRSRSARSSAFASSSIRSAASRSISVALTAWSTSAIARSSCTVEEAWTGRVLDRPGRRRSAHASRPPSGSRRAVRAVPARRSRLRSPLYGTI